MIKSIMKLFLIVFLIMGLTFSVLAQDDYDDLFDDIATEEPAETDDSDFDSGSDFIDTPTFNLTLLGDHSFEFHIPVIGDHMDFHGNKKAPRFNNDLGVEFRYKFVKLVSHWQLDLKLNEFGSIEDVLQVLPLENSILLDPWKFRIRAGYQFFAWGSADGLNPTDKLNPRDYRFGFNSDKLAVLSAAVEFYPVDFFAIEAVYVPFKQKSKFPIDVTGALLPNIPAEIFLDMNQYIVNSTATPGEFITIPVPASMTKNVNVIPGDFNFSNFVLGGKASFFFRYADFSVSYLTDIDNMYTASIETVRDYYDLTGDAAVFVQPFYGKQYRVKEIELSHRRVHHFGFDLRTTADRFTIWLEANYMMTDDFAMNTYAIRNHKLEYILGFGFNYGPNQDFYFNLQYFGNVIPFYDYNYLADYEDGLPDETKMRTDEDYLQEYLYRTFNNQLGGYTEALTQGISLFMEWPLLNNVLKPSIAVAYIIPFLYTPEAFSEDYEIRAGSLAIKPELDIQPIDSLHILIGADLSFSWHKMPGSDWGINHNDQLGYFYNDNNIYIEVKYKWNYTFSK